MNLEEEVFLIHTVFFSVILIVPLRFQKGFIYFNKAIFFFLL